MLCCRFRQNIMLNYVHTVSFSLAFYIVLRPQGIRKQMKTLRKRHRVHIALVEHFQNHLWIWLHNFRSAWGFPRILLWCRMSVCGLTLLLTQLANQKLKRQSESGSADTCTPKRTYFYRKSRYFDTLQSVLMCKVSRNFVE